MKLIIPLLCFFQNLKVKGPKDSKDCTTTVSMEGKCVCDLVCTCVFVFVGSCHFVSFVSVHVCLSMLACCFKTPVLPILLVYAVAVFGTQTGVCVSTHTHTHTLALSLSLYRSLSLPVCVSAWEGRQWAAEQSEAGRWGIWRCFWSSDCVVTAHTVTTAWYELPTFDSGYLECSFSFFPFFLLASKSLLLILW